MTRELVWTGFLSADGVMDAPGDVSEGHPAGGWVLRTPVDEQAFALKGEEMADTTALLLGRVSYEAFAPVWSRSPEHAQWNDLPKYVVSSTLQESDLVEGWGETTILRTIDDVASLKHGDGGGIFIHGSGTLTRNLSDAGLVDRYNVLQFPVLLGEGRGVFGRATQEERRLELVESAAYDNGVVKLIYSVSH